MTISFAPHMSAPRTVTVVPPAFVPELGVADHADPEMRYVKCTPEPRPSRPPLLLTDTLTVPAPRDGATQVTIEDVVYSARTVSFSPKRQIRSADFAKCSPTTFTTWPDVPPTPTEGHTLVTVALVSYRNSARSDVKWLPSSTLTSTATAPTPDVLPGATHAKIVDDTNWAPSTSSVPKRHRSPASRKPDPATLTTDPPATEPRSGHSPNTAGIE
jgi:hypothetical protein